MTRKLKGRPPSFELIQALQLIAGGHPVKPSAVLAGVPDTNVWRVLKTYGGAPEAGSSHRARQALTHYCQPLPRVPITDGTADGEALADPQGTSLGCGIRR